MGTPQFFFSDRDDAGRQLAERLQALAPEHPVVYALPRGGVPVAVPIARALAAPLDLLLVRKIGAPGAPELALGAVVEGQEPQAVINEDVRRLTQATDAFLDQQRRREIAELERRRALYLGSRPRIDPAGCTVIVVDDGLATGATARAALIGLKRQGAARVILAVPVAPIETLEDIGHYADLALCLQPVRDFTGVGAYYHDFHQLTDEETIGLLRQAWSQAAATGSADPPPGSAQTAADGRVAARQIAIPPSGLVGDLRVPPDPRGIIVFAHGSGSSRLSPRNATVAEALNARGFATLLLDLLAPDEAAERRNVFDIPLLAERLVEAVLWIRGEPDIAELPLGLFGASTGAGAALLAAAELRGQVGAVVSRGGRPDLAGPRLRDVRAPTLLIVGGNDAPVIELNRQALAQLACDKLLRIVPGATHLFEEAGALEAVTRQAGAWFEHYLAAAAHRRGLEPAARAAAGSADCAVLRAAAQVLPVPEDPDFATAFDRFGSARIVLLGESSHGTSEFYRARAAITRGLIERHGFTGVAVEADWPDAAVINRYVHRHAFQPLRAPAFARFPTWMWRNQEVDAFVAFLRRHNGAPPGGRPVGFYGLDLYNMTASIAAVLDYLDRVDPPAADVARRRYACLEPWSREPSAYGRAALTQGYALCERPVVRILTDLLQKELDYAASDAGQFFDARQNAHLVADAERYYRVMYYGAHESWNLRDRHMFDTLQRILDWIGPDSKVVVWAHNSHIGDARHTDMGQEHGELNLGQLCRQAYGRQAALVGFGMHGGTVAAASEWDAPMEVKSVRPSRADSYEALFHATGLERFLLDLRAGENEEARRVLAPARLERYIGVIYRPDTERWSHYSYARLPEQYDAFVWFDSTQAVAPLPTAVTAGEDETYPFGL